MSHSQVPICSVVVAALLVSLGMAQGSLLHGAEEITVHLRSGRSFVGYLDEQTTEQELVLRQETPIARLWRPIAWSRVEGAERNGEALTTEELRGLSAQLQSAAPSIEDVPPPPSIAEINEPDTGGRFPVPVNQPGNSFQTQSADDSQSIDRRVVTLQVHASLANWNYGVEQDGIALQVFPVNNRGEVAPVAGFLEVDLIGVRPAALRGQYVEARGLPFPSIARWTRQIKPEDYGYSGAVLRLPFQAIQPEFRLDFAPYGLVTVRLSIPGQGVYSATAEIVRVRPFSPVRDWQQQQNGRRFFGQEQLSRTQ